LVTSRRRLRFRKNFATPIMLAFVKRLLRSVKSKVFLILDRHPVHRARRWIAGWKNMPTSVHQCAPCAVSVTMRTTLGCGRRLWEGHEKGPLSEESGPFLKLFV
jgi:hypothetical protein